MKKLKNIGELKLVKKFRDKYKSAKHTLVGIGDDAAVISIPDRKRLLLFTCDTLVEGVHFIKRDVTGFDIGWKALGAGLSDIAAMAGEPVSALVSLAMPPNTDISFVNGLIQGMNLLANRFGVDIVGGDTVSSPKTIVISIAVIGVAERRKLTLRSGAKIGDKILVTGTLGGSMTRKQFNFIPRIKEAQWLTLNGRVNAMIDITDGLSLDLHRLITESKVGARLYKESIPISIDAYRTKDPFKSALTDGEDFELLIATPDAERLIKKWKNNKMPLTIIGEITEERGKIKLVGRNGKVKKITLQGYEHFKR